jgi:hypothetical protein
MILDKNLASFLFTTLTNQPSRAFRHDKDSKKLDTRHKTLQSSRQDPLQSPSLIPQRTKANPSSDDTAKVPKRVINSRDLAPMSWVCDLGDEKRTGCVGNVGAAAHDESTDEV